MKVCMLAVPALLLTVQVYCPMSAQFTPDISRSPDWLTLSLPPSRPTTSWPLLSLQEVVMVVVVLWPGLPSLQGKVMELPCSTMTRGLHTEI